MGRQGDAGSGNEVDGLVAALRAFVQQPEIDRDAFIEMTRRLHALPIEERRVAYDYVLATLLNDPDRAQGEKVRAMGRLADLIGSEPPEIGSSFGAQPPPR